ncbi:acetyl-CoA carboxylase biotin carboxylase subunit family protein [Streptacidiphilus sp. N1-12]|uniref:Acetyl-CoA carboxylase biotin carboxylase subunit family protein n=2 Tax=Streptacidiphilus alkalitolerans TaxID=3342712 RepID=A0ABV6VC92_9ACTN
MRRIAFLRSIEVQQTDPYLNRLRLLARDRGLTFKLLFTDGECGPEDFPGEAEKLAADVSPAEIVERLRHWGADGVVSLSIPDENSVRDAVVRESLAEYGIPMVMHGLDATTVLANKWETKQAVRRHGLATPEGLYLDGDLLNQRNVKVPAYHDHVRRQAHRLGFPLLSKPLWDCLGTGIRFLPDDRALDAYLDAPYDGNTVLEKCLPGELCSVEIVGTAGDYVAQPLIWKGPTGGAPSFAFSQVRYAAPRPLQDEQFRPVLDRLLDLCAGLELHGAVEVEMIHDGESYQVIEINPRVSGSTTLSIAASGDNTYAGLVELLLGEWAGTARSFGARRRLAYQVPTRPLDPELLAELGRRLDLVRASSFHIDGHTYANMVLTCAFDGAAALADELGALTGQYRLLTPAVLAETRQLLAPASSALAAVSG